MALTQLDSNAALVLIDLQKGILGMGTVHPIQEIVSNAAKLARAFRASGRPVVLVHVTGMAPGRTDTPPPKITFAADFAEFVPELEHQPVDKVVNKQRWGAFLGTDLHEWLKSKGVNQLLFGGVATTAGVESSARSAWDLGYNVVMVSDAMTDRDKDAHDSAFSKTFPRMAEIDTTENVLKLLG